MQANMAALLNQVPDLPDRYDPTAVGHSRTSTPVPQRKRQRIASDSSDVMPPEYTRPKHRKPDTTTQVALNLLFPDDFPDVAQRQSGPSRPSADDSDNSDHSVEHRVVRARPRRRARARCDFLLSEAEEGSDSDSDSASHSHRSRPQADTHSHTSDADDTSDSESDDSFVVADDIFD